MCQAGVIPPGAVPGGHTATGDPLYVAKVGNTGANYDPNNACAEYEYHGAKCGSPFYLLILRHGEFCNALHTVFKIHNFDERYTV